MKKLNAQLNAVLKAKEDLAKDFDGNIGKLEEHLLTEQDRLKKAGNVHFERFVPTPIDVTRD